MDPVTIGFLATTAISIGSKIFGGMAANKAAQKAAEEQAAATTLRRTEEMRQRRLATDQQYGESRAKLYASNIQESGSSARYLQAMDMENMREQSYARYAAKKEQEAILESGQGMGTSLFIAAAGDALGAASTMFASSLFSPEVATNGGIPGFEKATLKSSAESLSYTSTPMGMGA